MASDCVQISSSRCSDATARSWVISRYGKNPLLLGAERYFKLLSIDARNRAGSICCAPKSGYSLGSILRRATIPSGSGLRKSICRATGGGVWGLQPTRQTAPKRKNSQEKFRSDMLILHDQNRIRFRESSVLARIS